MKKMPQKTAKTKVRLLNDGNDALADEPDANNNNNKNTGETQGVTWATTLVEPLARATRSAVRAGRVAPLVNTTNLDAKQTRELAHLEAYYNKDAENILDEARMQENQLD